MMCFRRWLASSGGCKTTVSDTGVKFEWDGWSEPAHVELTPVPMINNAMARVHAAVTAAFATAM
jgi:hypothetical protein